MKKMKLLPLLSLILSVLACVPAYAAEPNDNNGKTLVVFDIGDVLITYDPLRFPLGMDYINLVNVPLFAALNYKGLKRLASKPGWFEILQNVDIQSDDKKETYKGIPLPSVMRAHQKNDVHHKEIYEKVKTTIKGLTQYWWYERALMYEQAKVTFDPQANAAIMTKINSVVEIVKECKKAGYDVALLSNYNSEAYDELEKKFPELFDLFPKDKRFVSGKMRMAKPDIKIFEKVIELTPEYSIRIFVDDQPDNVASSIEAGMIGIQHTSALDTWQALVENKILPWPTFKQYASLSFDKNKSQIMKAVAKRTAQATIFVAGLYMLSKGISKLRQSPAVA